MSAIRFCAAIKPVAATAVPLRRYSVALATAQSALYVAFDNGEWGGGIYRIALSPDSAAPGGGVEPLCTGRSVLCGGISGLAPDPARHDAGVAGRRRVAR